MARLKSNTTELYRLEKVRNEDSNGVNRSKTVISIRSNMFVLKKLVVWFKFVPWESEERYHDYGWKRAGKLTKRTPDEIKNHLINNMNYRLVQIKESE